MKNWQIEYFQVVAETQSISKAAELLYVSQPSVSKAIVALEEELGVPLFDRIGNKIFLNNIGRSFLQRTKYMTAYMKDTVDMIRDMDSTESGTVAYSSPQSNLLGMILSDYIFAHPENHIRQYQLPRKDLINALYTRKIDFGFSFLPISGDEYVWIELKSLPAYVILSVNHPLANRDSISLAELRNDRFVFNNSDPELQRLYISQCRALGFDPNSYFEGDEPTIIAEYVTRTNAVSIISALPAKVSYQFFPRKPTGTILVPLEEAETCLHFGVVRLKANYYMSSAAQDFYDYSCQKIQDFLDDLSCLPLPKSNNNIHSDIK
mgnify:CR=1 FL=1